MTDTKMNKTFLIILLGILAALGPFTIDMYLPGFQRIAEDLSTDENHVAFTLTSYFIGIAVGQLIYGPVVDKYGRKKPLLFGLMIYIIAAIGCALSQNIETMIGMRLLQALGGCVGMVASNAIISDVYEKEHRAKAFSSIMLVMGVAPLIAPSFGSLLLVKADWEYIFYFLAVFSAIVTGLIYFCLPETSQYMHSNKLKVSEISKSYFEILKNKTFLFYTLAGSIAMSILFAYVSSAPYVFLTVYELDKSTFSMVFAVNASGLIAGSYINGMLTNYFNYIKIAKVASWILSIVAVSILVLIYSYPGIHHYWVVAGIFSILFMIGFINPNATAASLASFTDNAGAASALGGAIRMGVGALVATIIGLFQGDSANTLFITIFGLAFSVMLLLSLAPILSKRKASETILERI
jgi:DHA1 family bicyclomycin/chloramphenicol resistance-like MFS transporter